MFNLTIQSHVWQLNEPFQISRGTQIQQQTLVVTLTNKAGKRGRGEACGVNYEGETVGTMTAELENVRKDIESGCTRAELLSILPAGGARFAIDAALWDLEAKNAGRSAFALAGYGQPHLIYTDYTIGIRSLDQYEEAARQHARHRVLKIKVDSSDPLSAVSSVRRGAPESALIVDPNQAWSVDTLQALAPELATLGVVLLEQPIKVGDEAGLDGYRCPIRLCADELVRDARDLSKARGRFDVVNIKLDKAGGLTEALRLAAEAKAAGFELMVGCMGGSSLCMAPALVLAQQCKFVDLDGPLLQSEDVPYALVYHDGHIAPPHPNLWG
jgi:L-Ala-D/L-Glu epimerase